MKTEMRLAKWCLLLVVGLFSALALPGCKSTSEQPATTEPPNAKQPASEQPTQPEHPTSEHPTSEHPN